MAFLRNLLATFVGLVLFSIFASFVFLFIIAAVASSGEEVPTVKANSVLYMNMSGVLTEREMIDPIEELLIGNGPRPIGLMNTLDAIDAATDDERIKGIYLETGFLQAGYSSLSEIREALQKFKETGKFVYAYGSYISEGDYYLASVADSLFLNPEGALEINGLSANITFFKGAFEKLGVEPEVFRVGKFKSFVEPYIREDMSAASRLQTSAMLNSLYAVFVSDVATSMGKQEEEVRNISDQMLIRLPEDAARYGMVSRIAYEDEVKDLIRDEIGLDKDDKINF
ncbi:MAG: S49 family peptidase, partial [Bacteroidota bacterium]